jgi:hypothetical protein
MGSTRRIARVALAFGAALVVLGGCGGGSGDSGVETFEVDLAQADGVQTVFQSSLLKAVEMCGAEDPPVRVQWKFAGDDEENPIAQEYIRGNYPSFIECSAIPSAPGAPSTTAAGGAPAGSTGSIGPRGSSPSSTSP